jgi:hypothetical protein
MALKPIRQVAKESGIAAKVYSTIDGYPIVQCERDAYAVYDCDEHQVVAWAPGSFWSLSKSKALRERGTSHRVVYVGFPPSREARVRESEHAREVEGVCDSCGSRTINGVCILEVN